MCCVCFRQYKPFYIQNIFIFSENAFLKQLGLYLSLKTYLIHERTYHPVGKPQGSAANTLTVFLHTNTFRPDLPQYNPVHTQTLPVAAT